MAVNKVINIGERTTDPDTNPDVGTAFLYVKNGTFCLKDSNGNVYSVTTPVFGKGVEQSIFEDYTFTTAGTTYSTYCGLQCNQAGEYLVIANASIKMNTTSYDAQMRISKNSSTVSERIKELKDSSAKERVDVTIVTKVTLANGDYLDLDFATENASYSITVYEASLVLWRVA